MCDECGECNSADEDVQQRLDEMARMLIQKMNCIASADATQHHRTLPHQKDGSTAKDGGNSLVWCRRGRGKGRGRGTPWTDQEHK
ncbi:hypothetical protein Fmac_004808 [Flemingia macrophylla]|uniref:Uncharacterized protein n=1 Tax=Flemingia macrophylla TaxID=520843 RepID=A0ABD1N684_9FABA